MKYTKNWTDIHTQVEKLRSRGLIIEDNVLAEHYLMNVGYYRFVGYWWPMQADKVTHCFKPGSKFENAVDINNFKYANRQGTSLPLFALMLYEIFA